MTTPKQYRADIDGLRALAVSIVIFYHLDFTLISGGFVGVDVFFVISGYLITSIIRSEIDQGIFSFREFYKRRALRILPALFAVMLSTIILGAILMTPQDFTNLAKSTLSTLFFASNIFFFTTVDYFAANEINPLLHTWSLAIEEQFYFAFPVIFLLLTKYARSYLLATLFLIALVSFAFSVNAVGDNPMFAFYAPHLRAWELLLGSLAALHSWKPFQSKVAANSASLGGLLAILYAAFSYTEETKFPGLAAIVPTLGCVLIILSERKSVVGSVLGSAIPRSIGLLSYSLYLWHWPIIKFFEYSKVFPLTLTDKAICLALTVILSIASYSFVEKPLRHGKTPINYRLIGVVSAAVFLVACSTVVIISKGLPARLSDAAVRYAKITNKDAFLEIYDRGGCFLDNNQKAKDYSVEECTSPSGTDVLIWGDSFAAHLYPGLRTVQDLTVAQFTATSCRPMLSGARRCYQFYDRFGDIARDVNPKIILIAGNWAPIFITLGLDEAMESLRRSIRLAKMSADHVVLVGQPPTYNVRLAYLGFVSLKYRQVSTITLNATDSSKLNEAIERVAKEESVIFYDFYTDCVGVTCPAFIDGEPLHWDGGHMTLKGSEYYTYRLGKLLVGLAHSEEQP